MGDISIWYTIHGAESKRVKQQNLSSIFTLKLSQKSDFQSSTTKSDNTGHPTVKIGKIWPLGGFESGFAFSKKIK